MPPQYWCTNCKDHGTIRPRGFLSLITSICPVCHGDPKAFFRKAHPTPHMPPESNVNTRSKTA